MMRWKCWTICKTLRNLCKHSFIVSSQPSSFIHEKMKVAMHAGCGAFGRQTLYQIYSVVFLRVLIVTLIYERFLFTFEWHHKSRNIFFLPDEKFLVEIIMLLQVHKQKTLIVLSGIVPDNLGGNTGRNMLQRERDINQKEGFVTMFSTFPSLRICTCLNQMVLH